MIPFHSQLLCGTSKEIQTWDDKVCAQHEQTRLLTNGSHALERGEAYEEPERSDLGIRCEEIREEKP